jgi:glycosyltransferase involved in cell wall biosynthesis
MKTLLVITGLGVGGAERLVTALAERFVAEGHEVVLVRFHGEAEIRPSDPRVRLENLRMRRSPLGVLAAILRLRRLILTFRPDVVNTHLVHANILGRLLRLITPMPRLVTSAHNTNEEGRARMWAYRATDRLADMSTNVSQEAVEAFEAQGAVKPGRMVAIHNGIDTDDFHFSASERLRIREELGLSAATALVVAVGRLWEPKDYPSLLEAMALLGDARSWHLAVVGDGPLRHSLNAHANHLGIAHRVSWLGIRHDVPALMSGCDLFVLSSAWEGFGLVVAEAMACERPVVATDCGGVREVVGDCGTLVPPRDPETLATAIEKTLAMIQSQKEALGQSARQRVVARYSITAMADRYLAVYRGEY